jgi:hypothetical protein
MEYGRLGTELLSTVIESGEAGLSRSDEGAGARRWRPAGIGRSAFCNDRHESQMQLISHGITDSGRSVLQLT